MQRLIRCLTSLTIVLSAGCGGGGGGVPQNPGLLAGSTGSPASAAIVNVGAQPAADADIDKGMILSRLDVVIAADATVAQVNAAFAAVGATSITAARAGSLAMSVAVPRQANAEALEALAATLEAQPGILAALPAPLAVLARAPQPPANADVDFGYLQRARFPAAWNARAAAGNCASSKTTVIVADMFHRPLDALYAQFPAQVPGVVDLGQGSAPPTGNVPEFHGHNVLTTLAAALDATVPTGANPFPECLDIKALQIHGLTPYGITAALEDALVASSGKMVVNASFGWDGCGAPATERTHPLAPPTPVPASPASARPSTSPRAPTARCPSRRPARCGSRRRPVQPRRACRR
jgi:hypothetical protein